MIDSESPRTLEGRRGHGQRCRCTGALLLLPLLSRRCLVVALVVFQLSRQVHSDCSLIAPEKFSVFSGLLRVHLTCSRSFVVFEDALNLTFNLPDSNFTQYIRATVERPSGGLTTEGQAPKVTQLYVECGKVTRAGRYSVTTAFHSTEDHVTTASGQIEITWPVISLVLPESHVTLSSELIIRATSRDVLCDSEVSSTSSSLSSSSRSFRGRDGFQLELFYLGLNPGYTNELPHTPEPIAVYTRHVTALSQLTSLDATVPCSAVDQAGFYAAALLYAGSLSDSPVVTISNRMRATWSPAYSLHPVGSGSGIFPCPVEGHLDLRYTQPLCYNKEDRIRVYRRVWRVEGGGIATPVDLVYITERRADGIANVARFPCSVFDEEAVGYCFKYVSTANSGSVREQKVLCIPVKDNSESAIDGGWSPWSPWSPCSSICGPGLQTRHRTCDNPKPSRTGKFCPGGTVETRSCETVCRGRNTTEGYPLFPEEMEAEESHCSCGCEIRVDSISTGIASPFSSSSNQNCSSESRVWHIKATRDHVIELTYDLEVAPGQQLAPHRPPWVQVRDGPSSMSTMLAQSFEAVQGQTVRSTQPEMMVSLRIPVDDQSETGYDSKQPIRFKASFVGLVDSKIDIGDDDNNNTPTSGSSSSVWRHSWQTTVTAAGVSIVALILVCCLILVCHRRRIRRHHENEATKAAIAYVTRNHLFVDHADDNSFIKNPDSFELSPINHLSQQTIGYSSNTTDSSRKSSSNFRLESESRDPRTRSENRKWPTSSMTSSVSSPSSSTTRAKWPDGRSDSAEVDAADEVTAGNGNKDGKPETMIALGNEQMYAEPVASGSGL